MGGGFRQGDSRIEFLGVFLETKRRPKEERNTLMRPGEPCAGLCLKATVLEPALSGTVRRHTGYLHGEGAAYGFYIVDTGGAEGIQAHAILCNIRITIERCHSVYVSISSEMCALLQPVEDV